jgi:two-component system, NtrC family, response regulator AtoC
MTGVRRRWSDTLGGSDSARDRQNLLRLIGRWGNAAYNATMTVLVVDDDASVRSLLHKLLSRSRYDVIEAEDGLEAIQILGSRPIDLVITDLNMPRADGLQVLRHTREKHPKVPVLILTGENSIRDCVEAMRAGAFNFLTKPFHAADLDEIVRQALRARGPQTGSAQSSDDGQPQVALIGVSAALRTVIETVERMSHTSSTVLITGESGTGKEVVARLLHGTSGRASGPLVAINCGAIPEALMESEMFGHAKGSFTGATEARPGLFVQANGGTLFLDEIAELPLALQVKLLRVLQERRVTAVGDSRERAVDVRIIAATNRDLEAMVRDGTFRADLYYRLDVLPIHLPALRERREDIPLLVQHFLQSMNRRFDREVLLGDDALTLMKGYAWPGNVREMENLLERLVVLNRSGTIEIGELPPRLTSGTMASVTVAAASVDLGKGGIDLQAAVAEFEDSLIQRALRLAEGNKTRAAELLGLSRTTLLDKIKRQQ